MNITVGTTVNAKETEPMPRPTTRAAEPRRATLPTLGRPMGSLCLAAAAMLAGMLVVGCSSAPPRQAASGVEQALAGLGIEPSEVAIPYALTPEMVAWAHQIAPAELGEDAKIERLLEGLLDSGELELEYSWGRTGTAAEVFRDQKANCLAFTNLFVGMAREVGVPVFFVAVESATYRRNGEFVVVSDHIAVGHKLGEEVRLYDFSAEDRGALQNLRPINDLTAIAMFHSNRGAEALQGGDLRSALDWLRLAVRIDDELSNAWLNLGVTRRRVGDLDGAEEAYRRALEVDPRTYAAYQNLAGLLHFRGRAEEAREFEVALKRSPTRNPYTYISLGDISFRSGRLGEARRFYRRAAYLDGEDAEPYAALGQLAAAHGDLATARKMLRKAQRRDGDHPRAQRLAAMITGQGI